MGLRKRIKIAQATGKPLPADMPPRTEVGTEKRYVRIPDGPPAKKKKHVNAKPFMVNFLDVIISDAIRKTNARSNARRKLVVE